MNLPRNLALALAAIALLAIFISQRETIGLILSDATFLRNWVVSFGPAAPAVLIALQIVQIVVAPIPAQAIGMVSGYLYGFWGGLVITFFGGTLGSITALMLGRFIGKPIVYKFADEQVIAWVQRFNRVRSVPIWAVIFALPIGDPLLYAAGLTGISLRTLIVGAAIGRFPGMIFANFFGAETESLGAWAWVFGFVIGGILLTLFSLWHRQIQAATELLARRLGHDVRAESE
ncbi:MAG: VTT domain-containing protein [Chloroflexota bacterium]|nr:VTT domain-containing protein [Dehalococcoidia bacterium]MDW8254668.1 VTT domain-containing protein [Chloroflexota bacterium]